MKPITALAHDDCIGALTPPEAVFTRAMEPGDPWVNDLKTVKLVSMPEYEPGTVGFYDRTGRLIGAITNCREVPCDV